MPAFDFFPVREHTQLIPITCYDCGRKFKITQSAIAEFGHDQQCPECLDREHADFMLRVGRPLGMGCSVPNCVCKQAIAECAGCNALVPAGRRFCPDCA